jgi:hypothetical protein
LACLRVHSKPQLLKAVENGRHRREQACLLGLEHNAQRARQRQIQQARVPSQRVIEDHEGIRSLGPERQRLALTRAQVGDDRKEQTASGLADSYPVERFEGGEVHAAQPALVEFGGDGCRNRDGAVPEPWPMDPCDRCAPD